MKGLILLFCCILTTFSFALEKGKCLANPFSKKYLVERTQNIPRLEVFSCSYECMADKKEKIIGVKKVQVNSLLDEAKKTVCDGVKVKRSRWGHELDAVVEFYAFEANSKEVKDWAFKKLSLNNPIEIKKLKELKKKLDKVSTSYELVGAGNYKYFFKAAQRLRKIEKELPKKTDTLASELKIITKYKGINPFETETADFLVFGFLKTSAFWRLNY